MSILLADPAHLMIVCAVHIHLGYAPSAADRIYRVLLVPWALEEMTDSDAAMWVQGMNDFGSTFW